MSKYNPVAVVVAIGLAFTLVNVFQPSPRHGALALEGIGLILVAVILSLPGPREKK